MKTGAFALTLAMVGLFVTLTSTVSIMTVKSGAWATEGSVELLRLQMNVVQLQEEVLARSRERLDSQIGDLDALTQQAAASQPEEEVEGNPVSRATYVTRSHQLRNKEGDAGRARTPPAAPQK